MGSGLDALRLGLLALEIGPGDEVIVPANTYIATALAVSEVGADVVLADCDPATYNVDPDAVAAAVTSRTRALLPVHFTGQAAEMRPLLDLAASNDLAVVEDAAQAHGTLYEGRPCGSIGKLACFSFYPGKNLGAYGDAGMVTTSDASVAERTRRLRNYGERAKYDHVVKGVNSRLDGLQAAFLSVKLAHLPSWNAARLGHADEYAAELAGVGDLVLQKRAPTSTHVYHLFIVETAERDALREHLAERGIQTGIHYPIPIHLQEAYRDLGLGPGDFRRLSGSPASHYPCPCTPSSLGPDRNGHRCDSRVLRLPTPELGGVEERVADLLSHLLESGASKLGSAALRDVERVGELEVGVTLDLALDDDEALPIRKIGTGAKERVA